MLASNVINACTHQGDHQQAVRAMHETDHFIGVKVRYTLPQFGNSAQYRESVSITEIYTGHCGIDGVKTLGIRGVKAHKLYVPPLTCQMVRQIDTDLFCAARDIF